MKRKPIAEVISDAREDAGLSQQALSRLVALRGGGKLDASSLSRIEAGEWSPSFLTLVKIALGLGGRFIINSDGAVFRTGKGNER